MGELDDRVAIVTGSTRGIGRALAERFAAEGAKVVINGRSQDASDAAAAEIDGDTLAIAADVGSADQVNAMVQQTLGKWGRIDILVNNAGIALDHFITGVPDDEWDRVIATNLSGPFYATRAVVRPMKEREKGAIVNVISWAGLRGNVGQTPYSASKAGLIGLTLACAKELAKFGIRCNAISPAVATEIASHMPEELKKKTGARTPLRRRGTLDDVAEAVLFLAGDRSSYTTGQIVNVDGGIHLT